MSGRKLSVIFVILSIALFLFFIRQKNNKTPTLTINNQQILLEVADTNQKRSNGLSGRENLEEDHGMLFIFPSSGYHNFWMYKMKFPLDFVWIKDSQVVDITEDVPYSSDSEIPSTFTARKEFNRVLEIKAGKIKEWNIKIGDQIWYNF